MKSASDHMETVDKCYKALGMGDDDAEKSNTGELAKATKTADDAADRRARRPQESPRRHHAADRSALSEAGPRAEIKSQPMPSKGVLRVVEKAKDGGNVSDGDAEKRAAELLKSMSPEEQSMVLMKAALSQLVPTDHEKPITLTI